MAKIRLISYPAQESPGAAQGIAIELGSAPPFPPQTVEVRSTIDAVAALEVYKREVSKKIDSVCAVSMSLIQGRAPAGFRDRARSPGFERVDPA